MLFPTHNCLAAVQVLFRRPGIWQGARSTVIWLVLIAMLLAMTACGARFTPTPTLTPEPTRLTAQLFGKLVAVEGCLRVNTKYTSYLLAWPPDFTVSSEQDAIQIIKGNGEKFVLRIGEEVYLGGGEVKSAEFLSEQVRQNLPANCPGPYWVVGSGISSVDTKEESK